MPELPEVETVVRDLRALLTGARITGAQVLRERNLETPDRATFAHAITGRTITGARRRAKWILIDLDGGLVMLVHLRMTGQLLIVNRSIEPDPYVRVALELADGRRMYFRDVRAFGRVALVAQREDGEVAQSLDPHDAPLFADYGYEPLEASFTPEVLHALLRAHRTRLKVFLLDQRYIAGIGNIYADEALWRARLHPLSNTSRMNEAQTLLLHAALVGVLAEAVAARGSSIDDYTAPDGDGEMQERLAVYQRTGEPCLRCGATVRRAVIAGRGTHYCARCQRAPRGVSAPTRQSTAARGPRWADRLHPDAAGATRAERAAARRRAARGGGSGARA